MPSPAREAVDGRSLTVPSAGTRANPGDFWETCVLKDMTKTKAQLVDELEKLRARVAELEAQPGGPTEAVTPDEDSEHFRALIEGSSDVITVFDEDGTICYSSPAVQRILGYPPDANRGKSVLDLIHPEDLERVQEALTLRFEKGFASGAVECRARHQDGRWIFIEATGRFTFDSTGRQRLVVNYRDISERKRTEAALRESEERFRSLIESAASVVLLLSPDLRVLEFNAQAEEVFGRKRGDVLGESFLEVCVDPSGWDDITKLVAQVLSGEPVAGFEKEAVVEDGTTRVLTWNSNRLLDSQGEPAGVVIVGVDITERKRAEEERRHLEIQVQHTQKLESLGVLAGGIAHDFNNLLMAILGNADLALQDLPETSPARPSIEEIGKASLRAAELVRQMLAYSGRGHFVVKPVDLSEIIEDMTHLLKSSVAKSVGLKMDLQHDLPAITADTAQIQQIVMNLIVNASESFGDGEAGLISVATGVTTCTRASFARSRLPERPPAGRYVSFEVKDSGCGMDDEVLAKIFDPFFTTKFTGRGLGLAAVLGIVRGHSGAILVESKPGKGTTVSVLFPAISGRPRKAPREKPAASPGRSEGVVLLVDDEDAVRLLAERILVRSGYTVLKASDGLEAVELFKKQKDKIDCVLLDLSMPRMGGEEAFQELHRLKNDVRVIMTSGYSEQETAERFAGQDVAGFIQKPYKATALSAKMKEVLDS
jgi:PAS domain S-box-containing protein